MGRKHYQMIADVLKKAREMSPQDVECIEDITHALADIFEQDNPNFQRDKFLAAIR